MAEKVSLDSQEVGDRSSNVTRLEFCDRQVKESFKTERDTAERSRTKEMRVYCRELLLSCCCTCYRSCLTEAPQLSHLQSISRRFLSKQEIIGSKFFIIEDLLLFAVAEVVHHRKSPYASLCNCNYDGNVNTLIQCHPSSSSHVDVESLTIFHKYLDEHDRKYTIQDGNCSYSFTSNTRKQIILWLLDIGQLFNLNSETVALTVAFMDKLIGKRTLSRRFLHGTVGGCLCTFSKWLDFRPVSFSEIASIVNVPANLLKLFEKVILLSLDWRLQLKTVHDVFSKIAVKFKQFYWKSCMNQTLWEEVVSTIEQHLNVSLLCEELSTCDHCIVVVVVLWSAYKKMLREDMKHKEIHVDEEKALVAELFAQIAKECDVSEESLTSIEHLFESVSLFF